MNKRWLIKQIPEQDKVNELARSLRIEPVLASLLIQRGIDDFEKAEQFFKPELAQLHDPFLMKNMDAAVERLNRAIESGEKIMLYGDYDVDGTTAVALMWRVLQKYSPNLLYYIPDRYREGYGVSQQGISFAQEQQVKLLITLDCGVKAQEQIALAREAGMDVIVCDHHETDTNPPNAIILDPKQPECPYPYKELSGCGVGFKLLQAWFIHKKLPLHVLYEHLDLLTVSIAADIVPITGENRILCFFGLQLINQRTRTCFQELLNIAKKDLPLTLTNVVFVLAPRINAAGRIDEGKKAVQLMITEDRNEIRSIAESIERDNLERRELDTEITEQALAMLQNDPGYLHRRSTVVYHPDWHKGVIGIVASRLIEHHYRPTIVFTRSNDILSGSARSIKGLNIHDAIESCSALLIQFGGHAHAAGLTLHEDQLENFKNQFELEVQRRLPDTELVPIQEVDYLLHFSNIYEPGENVYHIPKLKRIINRMEPHGPGNMKPIFVSENVFPEQVRVLKDAHLKMKLSQPGTAFELEAIGFNLAEKIDLVLSGEPVDVLYTLETNTWNQQSTLQLQLKDIRPSVG